MLNWTVAEYKVSTTCKEGQLRENLHTGPGRTWGGRGWGWWWGGVTFDEWNVFSWCVTWRRVAWSHGINSHNSPMWEPQIFRIYVLWYFNPKSSWHVWMKELRSFETSVTTNPAIYSYILAEQNLLQNCSENLRPQILYIYIYIYISERYVTELVTMLLKWMLSSCVKKVFVMGFNNS